jgi:hypothetical protein
VETVGKENIMRKNGEKGGGEEKTNGKTGVKGRGELEGRKEMGEMEKMEKEKKGEKRKERSVRKRVGRRSKSKTNAREQEGVGVWGWIEHSQSSPNGIINERFLSKFRHLLLLVLTITDSHQ